MEGEIEKQHNNEVPEIVNNSNEEHETQQKEDVLINSKRKKRKLEGEIEDEGDSEDDGEDKLGSENVKDYNSPVKKKRTGRRKISIEFIDDKPRRQITFSKRKAGLMKKAYELTTLTGTQALLLIASETGHVYTFATTKLQPFVTLPEGKTLIHNCLNSQVTAENEKEEKESQEEEEETENVGVNTEPQITYKIKPQGTPGVGRIPASANSRHYSIPITNQEKSMHNLNAPIINQQQYATYQDQSEKQHLNDNQEMNMRVSPKVVMEYLQHHIVKQQQQQQQQIDNDSNINARNGGVRLPALGLNLKPLNTPLPQLRNSQPNIATTPLIQYHNDYNNSIPYPQMRTDPSYFGNYSNDLSIMRSLPNTNTMNTNIPMPSIVSKPAQGMMLNSNTNNANSNLDLSNQHNFKIYY